MVDGVLPLAAMEKILKNAGAARVSADAKDAFRIVLEDYGKIIATKAKDIAKHAGRTTIKAEDIKLAVK